MENCKYNNHFFLLNRRQIESFEYFTKMKKPNCVKCENNKEVVKLIHSNTSRSLEKIYKRTGAIKLAGNQSKLNQWICKNCQNSF